MSVRIYTDGASSANGFGGFAAIMFVDGVPIDGVYGGVKDTTNNQMELAGLVWGMKLVPLIEMMRCANCGVVSKRCDPDPDDCPIQGMIQRPIYDDVVIVSDSEYCVKGATHWVHAWKANGWKTAQKQPVKNQSLWKEVDLLARRTTATFEWCKGHAGNAGNELADKWAVEGKMHMYGDSCPQWISKIPGFEIPPSQDDGQG
jgi:ribonuclease HI